MAKIYRYNQTPIEIPDEDIFTIEYHSENTLEVYLKDSTIIGYLVQFDTAYNNASLYRHEIGEWYPLKDIIRVGVENNLLKIFFDDETIHRSEYVLLR
jgi:hypothetical protein